MSQTEIKHNRNISGNITLTQVPKFLTDGQMSGQCPSVWAAETDLTWLSAIRSHKSQLDIWAVWEAETLGSCLVSDPWW